MAADVRIAEYLILLGEPTIQLATRLQIGEERISITLMRQLYFEAGACCAIFARHSSSWNLGLERRGSSSGFSRSK
jgi:hypothetical protein